jgi:formylglycine-generating enzyme required for sulfatase activity
MMGRRLQSWLPGAVLRRTCLAAGLLLLAITGESPAAGTKAEEASFWQAIRHSMTPSSFEAFLLVYPDGANAVRARERLDLIRSGKIVPKAETPPPPVKPKPKPKPEPKKPEPEKPKPEKPKPVVVPVKPDPPVVAVQEKPEKKEPAKPKVKPRPVVEKKPSPPIKPKAKPEKKPEPEVKKTPEVKKAQVVAKKPSPTVKILGKPPRKPTRPAMTENPSASPATTFKDCATCPRMVVIPAGKFVMGSPPGEAGRFNREGPLHSVTFAKPFAMGQFEVTRGEFAAFVRATDHKVAAGCRVYKGEWKTGPDRSWYDPGIPQGAQHPIVCLNWKDAKAYVAWLAVETKKPYRLPTEAEWEYAARAGTKDARFWKKGSAAACKWANVYDRRAKGDHGFPWGEHACDDGFAHTAPVGRFKANAFGLHDVLGNVWEWVDDCWNGNYDGAPKDGSAWTKGNDCSKRTIRAGSWNSQPEQVRLAHRNGAAPKYRNFNLGFRVALTLP